VSASKPYETLTDTELTQELETLENRYRQACNTNLRLNLTRGKPADAQLDLANDLDGVLAGDYRSKDGTDTRNYGGVRGLLEARELGGELLGVNPGAVIAGGNSSLEMMHAVARFVIHSHWQGTPATALCPVPGYDRHFSLCGDLDIDMQAVPLTADGPDMAAIEDMVASDDKLGCIWCVPRFSNPDGCVYSPEVVARMAALPLKARHPHFMIFWDNAYAVHTLAGDAPPLANLHEAAAELGTLDHLFMFASTSKITFAGAGIAFTSSSDANLAAFETQLAPRTIGPDKVNQLRTARFLQGRLTEHMAAHAAILRPKFATVQNQLTEQLGELGIAHWTQPEGGYFVSLNTLPGLAREVVALAASAGVTLTAAGATFPYGHDELDRNIRIAPTFPELEEVSAAMDVLTLAIRLASARKLLSERKP